MKLFFILLFSISITLGQKLLIPMDITQNDHLKAYGIDDINLLNPSLWKL